MKRPPRLTQGFTRALNPKLERFIRVNPTAVELIRNKPSLGPENGKWLKRASFIIYIYIYRSPTLQAMSGADGLTHIYIYICACVCVCVCGELTLSHSLAPSLSIYIYMYMYIYTHTYVDIYI